MESYREIIENQRKKLDPNISWWPLYLYHFTDINNAINIIDREYIYGRKLASEENLMNSDNASASVIDITNKRVESYARLYMRPKTPTQYHNEGYKPTHIRDIDINASCPVPIFFILDAERTLSMEGVQFVEKGLAGHSYDDRLFQSGVEKFKKLNFEKIFHDGSFGPGSDIKQFRHTEVAREDGIPIASLIKGIACRSIAEKQTLNYLLKKTSIKKYLKYKKKITYKPNIDLFYGNGIFVKNVKFEDNTFYFELNDSGKRYNAKHANGKDINAEISIDWLDKNNAIVERRLASTYIDYENTNILMFKMKREAVTNKALIEVRFDECMMYQNIMQIDGFELV